MIKYIHYLAFDVKMSRDTTIYAINDRKRLLVEKVYIDLFYFVIHLVSIIRSDYICCNCATHLEINVQDVRTNHE